MDLIDRSRTRARGIETNYVVVTGGFSALDTCHHSSLRGGPCFEQRGTVATACAPPARTARCHKVYASFSLGMGGTHDGRGCPGIENVVRKGAV